jgi:Cys/Met metabolism PLP-dependent enzyme
MRELRVLDLDGAIALQHRIADAIARNWTGSELMSAGDFGYGLAEDSDRPLMTSKAERAIAEVFGADDAALVWGAGTGANQALLYAVHRPGMSLLLHDAPIYKTTQVLLDALAVDQRRCGFNDLGSLSAALKERPDVVWVQHSPQCLIDEWDIAEVIRACRDQAPESQVFVDDNYAAMRVEKIGVELGAAASSFSLFKVLGPPGVGCVVGGKDVVAAIHAQKTSGGSKVQGPVARETMDALIYAPTALAIQNRVVTEIVDAIAADPDAYPGVKRAFAGDVNERAVVIELNEPRARDVVAAAQQSGAAPYPVGGESRYELLPLFYRLASAFVRAQPEVLDWYFRINPHRAGAETALRILRRALEKHFSGETTPGNKKT